MTQLHLPSALTASSDAHPGGRGAPSVASLLRQRAGDERLFTVLLWLSFPFFLVLAASARLMQGGSGERRASVFAVAAEAARSTIAIAFNQ